MKKIHLTFSEFDTIILNTFIFQLVYVQLFLYIFITTLVVVLFSNPKKKTKKNDNKWAKQKLLCKFIHVTNYVWFLKPIHFQFCTIAFIDISQFGFSRSAVVVLVFFCIPPPNACNSPIIYLTVQFAYSVRTDTFSSTHNFACAHLIFIYFSFFCQLLFVVCLRMQSTCSECISYFRTQKLYVNEEKKRHAIRMAD